MLFKFYEVGGKVRDEILGLKSKDVDYVAVPHDKLLEQYTEATDMFKVLCDFLKEEKFEIFLITHDCYTIRAKFPKDHKYQGIADFVMARKEIGYLPNTRTPIVKPGTLFDDLERRDFCANSVAKDENDIYIDFFNGINDIKNRILRTPLDPIKSFDDDCLRIYRALRFTITKDFTMSDDIINVVKEYDYDNKMKIISSERIREELYKCFKFNTLKTILLFNEFPKLRDYTFSIKDLWMKPTFEM